jgi:hypothetical protein
MNKKLEFCPEASEYGCAMSNMQCGGITSYRATYTYKNREKVTQRYLCTAHAKGFARRFKLEFPEEYSEIL